MSIKLNTCDTCLYRGKRLDNGEWIIGSLIDGRYIVGKVIDFNDQYFNTEFWYKVDKTTVGQFSGRFDSKKESLFKDDIIKVSFEYAGNNYAEEDGDSGYWIGVLNYIPSKGFVVKRIIQFNDSTGKLTHPKGCRNFSSCRSVLIGNLFDNPELLEK